ncbi:MAG: CDP-alcohol phosphatidyltransferase family protein [Anaerolineae bacterium]|nr:CDP-alcohol phosphatidyltransferase family protein [Anaerolineae bacterium]
MTNHNPAAKAPPVAFSDRLRDLTQPLLAWVGARLHRLGVHPDAVTVAALALTGVSGALIALGRFRAAAWVLLVGAPLDAVDGAVARAMDRKDRFGAVFDSTLDRYAEGLLFMGLSAYFARKRDYLKVALCGAAINGSFMVSYVRARVEGLGLPSIKIGLFSRFERMVTWFLMLFTGQAGLGLWVMAALTNYTAVQRLVEAYRLTQAEAARQAETSSQPMEGVVSDG